MPSDGAPLQRKRQARAGSRRRRTQQLEQHRRVADGDLAARVVGKWNRLTGVAVEVGDVAARRLRDARRHPRREAQEAAPVALLEQAPAVRDVVPRHDERGARRGADGDRRRAADQPFLDDALAVDDADAQQPAARRGRFVGGELDCRHAHDALQATDRAAAAENQPVRGRRGSKLLPAGPGCSLARRA